MQITISKEVNDYNHTVDMFYHPFNKMMGIKQLFNFHGSDEEGMRFDPDELHGISGIIYDAAKDMKYLFDRLELEKTNVERRHMDLRTALALAIEQEITPSGSTLKRLLDEDQEKEVADANSEIRTSANFRCIIRRYKNQF